MKDTEDKAIDHITAIMIATYLSGWYVRRDSKYYDIDNLNVKLSKDDIQRAALHRLKGAFAIADLAQREELREGFHLAIEQKHTLPDASIPVWDGRILCRPGDPARLIQHNGVVSVNCWREPAYRRHPGQEQKPDLAFILISAMITRKPEREKFLDWLAWNLQNEHDKPAWAPFLYSEAKGSGKSTLCELVARLFGLENTAILNSVDKLTSKFNSTVLQSKLVICEEVNLRPDSSQGNALKTYITEEQVLTERKGVDAEAMQQRCCFLFTSNHLPLWIEEFDRRYYLIDIDHDGHATGPGAAKFAELVGRVRQEMDDPAFLLAVYHALMERRLSEDFSPKTLNVLADATPLSRRVHGASELATVAMLREYLAEMGQHAGPEADVAGIIAERLKGNPNQSKHLMTKLGWSKTSAKWGGKDYSRALWVDRGYWIDRGTVRGPGDYAQTLTEHLRDAAPTLLRDEDQPSTSTWSEGKLY